MELQVIMDSATDNVCGSMWHSGSLMTNHHHQLSPRQPGISDSGHQQSSLDYDQISQLYWTDREHSPKDSPELPRSPVCHSNQSPEDQFQPLVNQCNLKRRSENFDLEDSEPSKKFARRIATNSSTQGWSTQIEELADHFSADFDSSLSAINANDLATAVASYNMSEALLSLPSLTVFKQEAPSPENHQNHSGLSQVSPNLNRRNGSMALSEPDSISCIQNSRNGQKHFAGNDEYSASADSRNHVSSSHQILETHDDFRFQYILAAPTSIATKVNEESLTYLNQGQSYEIKLKKLGDFSNYQGKMFKSTIRIRFHERRLQYMETEQILSWLRARPGERLLEVDIPLSYGMVDVRQPSPYHNNVEFLWDPAKDVGVYVKINCISTEFTPKKHGGEKGVPFRIEVETGMPDGARLHVGSCQVKVFKLKGADRKHKQDRDKIQKRPSHERDKYQPSYENTVLTDIALESLSSPIEYHTSPGNRCEQNILKSPKDVPSISSSPNSLEDVSIAPAITLPNAVLPEAGCLNTNITTAPSELTVTSSAAETKAWLRARRFQAYEATFASYAASDILCLSRDDLIQICGLTDGIRLYNALHSRAPRPKLSLYFACKSGQGLWRPIYLESLTSQALALKIIAAFGLPSDRFRFLTLLGPQGIHVLVTDDVVANLKDNSMFLIEQIKESNTDCYKLLLKPSFKQ